MRFMMLIRATPEYEAGKPPSPELMAGMEKLTREQVRCGALIAVGGLAPSSSAIRIRHANGRRAVIDGPFAETKELIGGYAIVEAASPAEALRLAQQVADVHAGAGIPDFEMEIRVLSHDMTFASAKN